MFLNDITGYTVIALSAFMFCGSNLTPAFRRTSWEAFVAQVTQVSRSDGSQTHAPGFDTCVYFQYLLINGFEALKK